MVDVMSPLSVSGVEAAFWNVCGVPVQATGTVVVVEDDVEVLVVEDEVELDGRRAGRAGRRGRRRGRRRARRRGARRGRRRRAGRGRVGGRGGRGRRGAGRARLGRRVELDVELEVVELDVLVVELVDVVVVVAKSQPMSVIRSRASDGSVRAVV
jgi:hypothetical protein